MRPVKNINKKTYKNNKKIRMKFDTKQKNPKKYNLMKKIKTILNKINKN